MAEIVYFAGTRGRKMRPTKNHRIAIWENMLGTLYAMNDERKIKYFDYDYDDARDFAGVCATIETLRDTRIAKIDNTLQCDCARDSVSGPALKKTAIFVLKNK